MPCNVHPTTRLMSHQHHLPEETLAEHDVVYNFCMRSSEEGKGHAYASCLTDMRPSSSAGWTASPAHSPDGCPWAQQWLGHPLARHIVFGHDAKTAATTVRICDRCGVCCCMRELRDVCSGPVAVDVITAHLEAQVFAPLYHLPSPLTWMAPRDWPILFGCASPACMHSQLLTFYLARHLEQLGAASYPPTLRVIELNVGTSPGSKPPTSLAERLQRPLYRQPPLLSV